MGAGLGNAFLSHIQVSGGAGLSTRIRPHLSLLPQRFGRGASITALLSQLLPQRFCRSASVAALLSQLLLQVLSQRAGSFSTGLACRCPPTPNSVCRRRRRVGGGGGVQKQLYTRRTCTHTSTSTSTCRPALLPAVLHAARGLRRRRQQRSDTVALRAVAQGSVLRYYKILFSL